MDGSGSLAGKNLIGPHPETTGTEILLPDEGRPAECIKAGGEPGDVVKKFPEASLPWAMLAEAALAEGRVVEGYAYARTGYHRGLDALRRAGWRGVGSIPFNHGPNQGFVRALRALRQAAALIDEREEVTRIDSFIRDSGNTLV